jgi:hypothetical protein
MMSKVPVFFVLVTLIVLAPGVEATQPGGIVVITKGTSVIYGGSLNALKVGPFDTSQCSALRIAPERPTPYNCKVTVLLTDATTGGQLLSIVLDDAQTGGYYFDHPAVPSVTLTIAANVLPDVPCSTNYALYCVSVGSPQF